MFSETTEKEFQFRIPYRLCWRLRNYQETQTNCYSKIQINIWKSEMNIQVDLDPVSGKQLAPLHLTPDLLDSVMLPTSSGRQCQMRLQLFLPSRQLLIQANIQILLFLHEIAQISPLLSCTNCGVTPSRSLLSVLSYSEIPSDRSKKIKRPLGCEPNQELRWVICAFGLTDESNERESRTLLPLLFGCDGWLERGEVSFPPMRISFLVSFARKNFIISQYFPPHCNESHFSLVGFFYSICVVFHLSILSLTLMMEIIHFEECVKKIILVKIQFLSE